MEISSAPVLTSQFLWNSALKLSSHQQKKLLPVISQLRETCISVARAGVENNSFQFSEVCQSCGNPWTEGVFNLKVLHHTQKMKKLKKRFSLNSSGLSKFNRNQAALFAKWKDNTMVKKCCICAKALKIGLTKPFLKKTEVWASPSVNDDSFTAKKNKKKKSKKDRFSGLLPSAVVNARHSLLSRDSIGGNTSFSSVRSESILSDITFQSDTTLESSMNGTNSMGSSNTISSRKEQKLVHEPLKIQSAKKNKKKKKKSSLVSDFLKQI